MNVGAKPEELGINAVNWLKFAAVMERREALMLLDPFAEKGAIKGCLKLCPIQLKPIHDESLVDLLSRWDILLYWLDDDLVMGEKVTTSGKEDRR